MEQAVITGIGIASPIGVGAGDVWASVEAGRSGVQPLEDLLPTDWVAPFGGWVDDFDPKKWVKPRKSLKVMAREIQLAFACGEQAWEAAGIAEGQLDPERMGVVCGAGLMYCEPEELEACYRACLEDGKFVYDRWGEAGMRELFPLWMLKYLPNMAACHLGIRRDARGPTNSIAARDASSLLALSEATEVIRRGGADVMLTGGSSSRLHLLDTIWREAAPAWRRGDDPAAICRPFDADRVGAVCGEGAAVLTLESQRHAQRRGAAPIARVAAIASRNEASTATRLPTGRAIEHAITAAIETAGVAPDELAFVSAHADSSRRGDSIEAQAIHRALGDVPVTAPKSFIGNVGAASGAVEMAMGLLALKRGLIPPTLNYQTPDPECPVSVATALTPTDRRAMLSLSNNVTGQAVAAVIILEQ